MFSSFLTVLRGGGDLATGTAYRLFKAGFPLIILETEHPLAVRRSVSAAEAVFTGETSVEGIRFKLAKTETEAKEFLRSGIVPVMVMPDSSLLGIPYRILVDARMQKKNSGLSLSQAEFVVFLGPGAQAGRDCHAVVETKRGHSLGRVIWKGPALADTGVPGEIAGKASERVLRACEEGIVSWTVSIGDSVKTGGIIGRTGGSSVKAPFDGIIRGLIAPGTRAHKGLKIGDIDSRLNRDACFTISDKSLAVGGGVLEAVLSWIAKRGTG